MLKALPSIITLGNLFCGFLAIAYIADNNLLWAAMLIFAGMIFDLFDGKVARMTKGSSDFGAELDSLSDMITFGVAPAFLVKVHIAQPPAALHPRLAWGLCVLFVICAAIRLARFNIETDHDESSHKYFKGLATPAGAGVLASMVLVSLVLTTKIINNILPILYYKIIMLIATTTIAILMVSNVKYTHPGSKLTKKRKLIIDGIIAFTFLAIITYIEPKLLIVLLSMIFLGYAFLPPLFSFVRLLLRLKDDKEVEEAF